MEIIIINQNPKTVIKIENKRITVKKLKKIVLRKKKKKEKKTKKTKKTMMKENLVSKVQMQPFKFHFNPYLLCVHSPTVNKRIHRS